MSERTVLVDMDGVQAGFHPAIISLLNEYHPHIDTDIQFENFYVAKDFPEHEELVKSISDEVGFFENLPIIDGAKEGWDMLIEAGYDPRVCSSPLSTHPNCEQEKRNWLEKYFGTKVAGEALIVKDKTLYSGLALIDDKPKITGRGTPTWQQILFTQPYNKKVETDYRLNGWGDERLLGYLKKLGSEALKFN